MEKNVQDARHRIWNKLPHFASLDDLNDWLEERCIALWDETAHPEQTDQSIASILKREQPHLMPVPQAFDGCIEHTKRVSPTFAWCCLSVTAIACQLRLPIAPLVCESIVIT